MAQVNNSEVNTDKQAEKNTKKSGKFSPKDAAAKVGRFFKELKSEFKKIVWPTKKQVINNTIVVIVMVVICGAVICGFDAALSFLVNLIY